METFLFWFFLAGLIVASLQDLKRREIDNWLNLFLLVGGTVFIFYDSFFGGVTDRVFAFAFLLMGVGIIAMSFYEARVFAGGDVRLLFALTPLFLVGTFFDSFISFGVFVLFLLIGGSIYGLIYSGVLYFFNFKRVNAEIVSQVAGRRSQVAGFIFIVLLFFFLGFVRFSFFILAIWIFLISLLYIFAKGLENVSMIREVLGSDLREGDWLVHDVVVYRKKEKGKRKKEIIKADWDGLSLGDIELLKNRRKVLIKDGLPFAPVFLIAFLGFVFLKSWFLGLIYF